VTLVAGDFVEVQLRVKLVVEFARWKLVTLGAPVMIAGMCIATTALCIVAIHQCNGVIWIGTILHIDQTTIKQQLVSF